jgi:phosphotransacetylase
MRTKSFIMERIVIQVDDDTAKKWRLSSQKRKQRVSQQINITMAKELCDSREDFKQFLDELRSKMEERGLTEEILQEILSDNE